MNIDKSKVFTLFALTLLTVSLVAINLNVPASAEPDELIYLHGPRLTPIHLNSNKTLTPVHMHYTGGILEPVDPLGTMWHELYPDFCESWTLTSHLPPGVPLKPNDQIDMTNDNTGEVRWYHVDRMTWTMLLYAEDMVRKIYVEYKGPYETIYDPTCTLWHEVWPLYSNIYHIVGWMDNGNGYLDVCDNVTLATFPGIWWHVEDYATDIILREKIMDPKCTWWHEVYPEYCNWYHLTSWEDDGLPSGQLSPSDQIDMTDEAGIVTWYHVDRVTITINVTIAETDKWMKLELKTARFEDMYEAFKNPLFTLWHEVYPRYSNVYNLTYWDPMKPSYDNCNGVLDPCDWIVLLNMTSGDPADYMNCHIEDMCYDLILNKKITDPVCTYWWELYPNIGNQYHCVGWEDNHDRVLSPCDQVNLTFGLITKEYHVENVTLSINMTREDIPGAIYPIECMEPFEEMYQVKTQPIGSHWTQWLTGPGGTIFTLNDWRDNCNGVLDHCDEIQIAGNWYHIEGVAIDMVVKRLVHDVAVTAVSSLYPWVYQGAIDPISVTVTNLGDYNEPTVDVYAFYGGNLAAPKITTSLNVGETKVLAFNWNTTGVPPGFYTVSANATIPIDDVPGNNYLSDGVQEVRERIPIPPLPREADLEYRPREVVDLEDPTGTQWHELHPSKENYYNLTSWEHSMVLGPEDWVSMMGIMYEVDDVTIDIVVTDLATETMYWLDYECGYWTFDPKEPVCTKWNEIKNDITHMPPFPPRCWHLTDWSDDSGDGELSFCDTVVMTVMYPYGPYTSLFHVEKVTVTLKLTEVEAPPVQYYLEFMGTLQDFKAMDYIHNPMPWPWNVIWPRQGEVWILDFWIDRPFLSPSDQILLTLKDPVTHEPIPGAEAWYHVDKLTVAMNLTRMLEETHIVKFEGSLQQFKKYHWRDPFGTQWHEVNPIYCRQWYLWDWMDMTGDGYLGPGDVIFMMDKKTGDILDFYVESLSTDIWVTQKICGVDITNVVPWFKNRVINGVYRAWTVPANPVQVLVTLHNNGTMLLNCTVNVYCFNATFLYLIGTQDVVNLPPCNTITLAFNWNVAVLRANTTYTLKANATCPCTAKDEFVYGPVKVRLWGDVDDNGAITILDIKKVKLAYSDLIDEPFADLDGDCDVDILDLKKEKLIYSKLLSPFGP